MQSYELAQLTKNDLILVSLSVIIKCNVRGYLTTEGGNVIMNPRIENLNKRSKGMFVGDWLIDIYNDKETKRKIHERAAEDLYSLLNRSMSLRTVENYLFLSLIYIGIDHYDGSFYEHLSQYYQSSYNLFSSQIVDSKIREYIKHVCDIDNSCSDRIIDYVLEQSFIPIYYLKDFYVFLYDIFVTDYDYYMPQEISDVESVQLLEDELSDLIKEIMTQSKNTELETIQVKLNNSYKTYTLTKGTRLALTKVENRANLIPIIRKMLNLFHADFWNKNITSVTTNEYLLNGFKKWVMPNSKQDSGTASAREFKNREVLKPKFLNFDVQKQGVIMSTRRHILNGASEKDSFEVRFYNGEEELYRINHDELILKRSLGGVKIESNEYFIENFLGELKYKVYQNSREVYCTEKTLFNDFLMFDENLKFLGNSQNYEGNVLIVTREELNNSTFEVQKMKYFDAYRGFIDNSTILNFSSHNLVINKSDKMRILTNPINHIKATVDGTQLDVYSTLGPLIVNIIDEDIEKLIISINGNNHHVQSLSTNTSTEDSYRIISLQNHIASSGVYHIRLLNSKNQQDPVHFIYDQNLQCEFITTKSYELQQEIQSSFFQPYTIFLSTENLQNDEIELQSKRFDYDNMEIIYTFDLTIDNYMIDSKRYSFSRYIWYHDIDGFLQINTKEPSGYRISNIKGQTRYYHVDNKLNSINIPKNDLELFFTDEAMAALSIQVFYNDKDSITLPIYRRNYYKKGDYKLIEENGKFFFKMTYFGKSKMRLKVIENNKIIADIPFQSEKFKLIPIRKDYRYELQIIEGNGINLFLEEGYEIKHQTFLYQYISNSKLSNYEYKVEKAFVDESEKGLIMRRVYLSELFVDSQNDLRGYLGYKFPDSKTLIHFEDINPVRINFLEDVIVSGNLKKTRLYAHILENEEDGLMIDKYKATIDNEAKLGIGPADRFRLSILGRKQ